jgi:hypothetical protein
MRLSGLDNKILEREEGKKEISFDKWRIILYFSVEW